jgi:hypothetical protein
MKSFESPGAVTSLLSAMNAEWGGGLEDGEWVYHRSVLKDVYREGEGRREKEGERRERERERERKRGRGREVREREEGSD